MIMYREKKLWNRATKKQKNTNTKIFQGALIISFFCALLSKSINFCNFMALYKNYTMCDFFQRFIILCNFFERLTSFLDDIGRNVQQFECYIIHLTFYDGCDFPEHFLPKKRTFKSHKKSSTDREIESIAICSKIFSKKIFSIL